MAETTPAVTEETVSFPSGTALISACLCRPAVPGPRPGVIVLHELWGITAHTKDVARRLAHAGYAGLAIDLYSRAGGVGNRRTFEEMLAFRRGIPEEMMLADITAGIRYLRAKPVLAGKIAIMGFSMGARYAVLSACHGSADIAAVVAYYCQVCYGNKVAPEDHSTMVSTVDRIPDLSAPLLAFYGDSDRWNPLSDIEWLRRVLIEHRKAHAVVVYPGAGHSFFDDTGKSYHAEAAHDSWTRSLDFLRRTLGG